MMTLCFGCCFWLRLRLRRRRLEHFFLDFFSVALLLLFLPSLSYCLSVIILFFLRKHFFSVWSLSFRCIIFLAFFGNEFFVSFLSFSFFSVDPFFFFESLVSLSFFRSIIHRFILRSFFLVYLFRDCDTWLLTYLINADHLIKIKIGIYHSFNSRKKSSLMKSFDFENFLRRTSNLFKFNHFIQQAA